MADTPEQTKRRTLAIKEVYLEFLDGLWAVKSTFSMLKTIPLLQERYPELSQEDARYIVMYWLNNYSARHP